MDKILAKDLWEELNVIDPASDAGRMASDKMRAVAARLMAHAGPEFDINEFTFLTGRGHGPQACFVNKKHALNGRHIIFANDALIKMCASESELAYVLGHELGHFIYQYIWKDSKNNIFQERLADLHSIDMMISAGYDPDAALAFTDKLFDKSINLLASLDVHGSELARSEDLRIYLTKKKIELGSPKPNPALRVGWGGFQKKYLAAAEKDGAYGFVESVLRREFKTDDASQILTAKIMRALIPEIRAGNIGNNHRFSDLCKAVLNSKSLPKERFQDDNFAWDEINKNSPAYAELSAIYPGFMAALAESGRTLKECDAIMDRIWNDYSLRLPPSTWPEMQNVGDLIDELLLAADKNSAERTLPNIREHQIYIKYFRFNLPKQDFAPGERVPWLNLLLWADDINELQWVLQDVFNLSSKKMSIIDGFYYYNTSSGYMKIGPDGILHGLVDSLVFYELLNIQNIKKYAAKTNALADLLNGARDPQSAAAVFSENDDYDKIFNNYMNIGWEIISEYYKKNGDDGGSGYKTFGAGGGKFWPDNLASALVKMACVSGKFGYSVIERHIFVDGRDDGKEIWSPAAKDAIAIEYLSRISDFRSLTHKIIDYAISRLPDRQFGDIFARLCVVPDNSLYQMHGTQYPNIYIAGKIFGGAPDFLKIISDLDKMSSVDSSIINKALLKLFWDALNKSGQIPIDAQGLLDWYAVCEHAGLFADNQGDFLDRLVDAIAALPNPQEMSAAVLSGNYFSDKTYLNRRGPLKFMDQRAGLINLYLAESVKKIGIDDGSAEKLAAIRAESDRIAAYKFDAQTQQQILEMLSRRVVSQAAAAKLLGDKKTITVDAADFDKHSAKGHLFDALMDAVGYRSESIINFLLSPLTDESVAKIPEIMLGRAGAETFRQIHKAYADASIAEKTVVMDKLLSRMKISSSMNNNVDFVANLYFGDDGKYSVMAKIILSSVVKNFGNAGPTMLAAIAASGHLGDEKSDAGDADALVGRGLRQFFETMGPAWIKFGQLVSYINGLPVGIRRELARLRDSAESPNRAEIFDIIERTVPNELRARIGRVGELLGAGSFWITVAIEFDGGPKVLQLLRPNASDKAAFGFGVIEKTVADLSKIDSAYSPMKNIAKRARQSADTETNAIAGNAQFVAAEKMYSGTAVEIDGVKYSPRAAKWNFYGDGYKIMDMAAGRSLNSDELPLDKKHDMARAYVALELRNMLAGGAWDIDRHAGQQNFQVLPDGNVAINIFDTGGMMMRRPGKNDRLMLGDLLESVANSVAHGRDLAVAISKKTEEMSKKAGILGVNADYIADIQKGLFALSDIIEYSKNPSKSLSGAELNEIISAVVGAGAMDKFIKLGVAAKMLMRGKRPAVSAGQGGIKFVFDAPDEFVPAVQMDKNQAEISYSETIMGIDKRYIKDQNDGKGER
ncbi:MAG: hypothetical protein LBO08_01780 [Rickettsiales bacterium]|jgi:hypothetical protein|nr:hypothetical protein [Rickettsiales bacterium]